MIKITEKQTIKIPGITSLFVEITPTKEILETIKTCTPFNYDKKTHLWEIPCTRLAKFINSATKYDDIELNILKDKKSEFINYPLSEYKTKPFTHQIEGIEYGLNHDNFLLLDDPGLGKTLQLIYLAEELKKRENIEHCLIICGINTLKTNWEKEILKHSNLDCIIPGKKISKNGNVTYGSIQDRIDCLAKPIKEFFVILNIESLRSDKIIQTLNTGPNKYEIVAVDEIHVCKSITSAQGKNLLKLKFAKHKIGMTGTLLLNDPLDVYAPLKWIGVEKSNFSTFKQQYIEYGGYFNNEVIGYKNSDSLKEQVSSCSLRRKKDLLDLPGKNIIDEYLDMSDTQLNFYKDILNGITSEVDKVKINTATILGLCTRLRQVTSCPSILTSSNIPSVKEERCKEHVEEIINSGNRVVIFSQFKKTLDYLLQDFKKYNALLCTGDISDDIISDNIEKFQNDSKYKIMLCTSQKMGTGITLNAASYAIFLETSFVWGLQEQYEDRIHRIGSKNPCFIYRLWCNNTFDLRVKQLLDQKKTLSDYIIDNKITNSNLLKNMMKQFV